MAFQPRSKENNDEKDDMNYIADHDNGLSADELEEIRIEDQKLQAEHDKEMDRYYEGIHNLFVQSEIQYRGAIITAFIPIEDKLNEVISEYYNNDFKRIELLLDRSIDDLNLEHKRKILNFIIEKEYNHYNNSDQPLKVNIQELSKIRNSVSHWSSYYNPYVHTEKVVFIPKRKKSKTTKDQKEVFELTKEEFNSIVGKCKKTVLLLESLKIEIRKKDLTSRAS